MKEKLNPLVPTVTKTPSSEEVTTGTTFRGNSNSKIALPPLPTDQMAKVSNDNVANLSTSQGHKKDSSIGKPNKIRLSELPLENSPSVSVNADKDDDKEASFVRKLPLDQKAPNKLVLSQLADNAGVAKIPSISTELRRINIKLLVDTIKPLIENNWTPLILDQSERCDIFFQYSGDYSGIFVEAKKLVIEVLVFKKKSLDEALEELRKMLVNAMKFGRTLVIRMTDTACDFLGKFNHPDFFPAADLLVEAGQRFKKEQYWSKVVREEDLEHGQFVVREEFCVVIVSTLNVEEYAGILKNAIPLSKCAPIFIDAPPPVPRSAYGI